MNKSPHYIGWPDLVEKASDILEKHGFIKIKTVKAEYSGGYIIGNAFRDFSDPDEYDIDALGNELVQKILAHNKKRNKER